MYAFSVVALTFIIDLAVHGGAGGLCLRRLEVNVRANGSMQQRLRRTIVVAQRSLGMVGTALHQAAQCVQLEEKCNRYKMNETRMKTFCKMPESALLSHAGIRQYSILRRAVLKVRIKELQSSRFVTLCHELSKNLAREYNIFT